MAKQVTVRPLDKGQVRHEFSGTRLVSTYSCPDGVLTATLGWRDEKTAAAYVSRAQQQFEETVVAKLADRLARPDHDGEVRRLRALRTPIGVLYVGVNTGPPTWWLPKVLVGRRKDGAYRVMVGWLRGCAHASFRPGRPAHRSA